MAEFSKHCLFLSACCRSYTSLLSALGRSIPTSPRAVLDVAIERKPFEDTLGRPPYPAVVDLSLKKEAWTRSFRHFVGPKRPHKHKELRSHDLWYPPCTGPWNQTVTSLCFY